MGSSGESLANLVLVAIVLLQPSTQLRIVCVRADSRIAAEVVIARTLWRGRNAGYGEELLIEDLPRFVNAKLEVWAVEKIAEFGDMMGDSDEE